MDYLSIAGLVIGTVVGFWYASRPTLSGKFALAFSLMPYAGAVISYFS